MEITSPSQPGIISSRIFRISKESSLALLFNIFYFIAISDVTSLNIAGGNIRWSWIALPFLCLLLPKGKEPRIIIIYVLALFFIHVEASFLYGSFIKGFVYSAWILVNYLLFFRSAYLITSQLKDGVWNAFLMGGRIQIISAVILVALGAHERAQFIYFEPSYLAIGLVPYLFASIFWSKHKLLDYSLILLITISNQSATMMAALFVSILFWLTFNKRFFISFLLLIFTPLSVYLAYWFSLNNASNPNHSIAVWISENGINYDLLLVLLQRGGNRIPRLQAALDLIDGKWLTGLGTGSYVEITSNMNFDYITDSIKFLDPAGLPVINVILEAIANAGIFAALILTLVFLTIFFKGTRIINRQERFIILGSLTAFGIMLQFESSYLRAYVWFAFGVFAARSRKSPAVIISGNNL